MLILRRPQHQPAGSGRARQGDGKYWNGNPPPRLSGECPVQNGGARHCPPAADGAPEDDARAAVHVESLSAVVGRSGQLHRQPVHQQNRHHCGLGRASAGLCRHD